MSDILCYIVVCCTENIFVFCFRGILNVHGSLLPRWRGAAPIIYAIKNADPETGVTIMNIEPHKYV